MKITSLDQLDLNGTYSYADYLKWTIDERIELIKGKIFRMSPAPVTKHQIITGEIYYLLKQHVGRKRCQVFIAPFDVRLTPRKSDSTNKIHTVVQPDVCVICDPNKVDERGGIGSPDLIVEVLSPGNTRKEMGEKYGLYEENGVREYWLVEPNDRVILVYVLNDEGRYIGLRPFTEDTTLTSTVLPDFELNVSELFENTI